MRDEGEARGDTHSVSDQVREDAGRRVGRRSAGAPLAAGGLLSGGRSIDRLRAPAPGGHVSGQSGAVGAGKIAGFCRGRGAVTCNWPWQSRPYRSVHMSPDGSVQRAVAGSSAGVAERKFAGQTGRVALEAASRSCCGFQCCRCPVWGSAVQCQCDCENDQPSGIGIGIERPCFSSSFFLFSRQATPHRGRHHRGRSTIQCLGGEI